MLIFDKKILAHSTIQISWQLLYSGIRRAVESPGKRNSVFSLEALPNIILGCSALEAFCNEMSSMVSSLCFEHLSDPFSPIMLGLNRFEDVVGVSEQACRQISEIKMNARDNTLDRYKKLCSALSIGLPENYQDLFMLVQVRHRIVHFRACDINVVDRNGTITYDHDLPDFYDHLKEKKYRGYDLIFVEDVRKKVAEPGEIDWVTRISTPAIALWAIEVVIEGILHVLENIPEGELKHRVENAYRPSKEDYQTLFHWGQNLVDEGVGNVI